MKSNQHLLVGEVNPVAGRGPEIYGGRIWERPGNRIEQVDIGVQGQGCLQAQVCG